MRLFSLLLVASSSCTLLSAEFVWNLNANGNWNNAANWNPNTGFPNAIGDIADLFNITTAARIITLGQNITIGTLHYDSAFNYTITGANTLLLQASSGNAAINLTNTHGNATSHVISSGIQLNSNLLISQGTTSSLNLSGAISGIGGITLTGSGTGAVILNNATNSYGGSTTINSGTITYNANGAIPAASAVTIGDGISSNAALTIAATMTQPNALAVTINSNGTLTQNSSTQVFLSSLQGSGVVSMSTTNSAASASNLFDVSLASNTIFSGSLSGGAGSAATDPALGNRFIKEGTGTLTLSGVANNFSARTFISNGVIDIQNGAALGTPLTTNAVYVRSSGGNVGSLYLENNVTLTKNIFLNGTGFSSTGALRNLSGANTLSGNMGIGWSGGAEVASDVTIQVDGTSLTVNGIISGTRNVTKTHSGTLIYTGGSSNTLTGTTTIDAGTLQLSKTAGINAIASNASVIVNSSATLLLGAQDQISNTGTTVTLSGGIFNMAGFTETIGSLIFNSGTLTQAGAALSLSSTAATALTMSDATSILGPLAFTAAGGVTYNGTTTRALISGDINLGTTAHSFSITDGLDTVDMQLSGVISGTGSITKTGTGVLLFDGTSSNTYTGLTTVNAGQLSLNKSSGSVAIAGSLTISGGSAVLLSSDQISDTATVTVSGGTFDIGNFNESIGRLTYSSGTVTNGSSTLNLTNASGATALDLGNGVTLSRNIALTGTAGTGGRVNYSGTTATSTLTGNLDLGPTVGMMHSFTINDGTATTDLEISGVISGAAGITKPSPAGRLDFTGSSGNTYTGTTLVSFGTLFLNKSSGNAIVGDILFNDTSGFLVLGNNNQIADTSNMQLVSGTFNMNGFSDTIGSLDFRSGTLNQGVTPGTLGLANPGVALTMRNVTIGGPVTLTNGGSVRFNAAANGTATLNGLLNLGGNTTSFDIDNGTTTTDMLITNVITNGGITKIGAGQLEFSGSSANTYTGTTTISAGNLLLNKTTGINAIAGDVLINGGTLTLAASEEIADTSTVTLSSGTFDMGGFAETISSLIFDGGTLNQGGAVLSLAGATNALTMRDTTISGPISITNGGSITFDATNNGTATLNGLLNLGGNTTSFDIDNGTTTTDMLITNVITNGGITKIGAGQLEFSGSSANTYTGTTTISAGNLLLNKTTGINAIAGDVSINGGTLTLGASQEIADTSTVTLSSGTFDMGGFAETISSLIFDGGTLNQGGALLSLANTGVALTMQNVTIGGPVTLTNGGSVRFNAAANGTAILNGLLNLGGNTTSFDIDNGTTTTDMLITNVITNGGITKIGAGQLEFSGSSANTYTGTTTISAGNLLLNKTTGINAIAGDVLINGGTLTLGASQEIADTSTVTLSSGTFDMGGFAETIDSLIFDGGTLNQGGALLSLASATNALTMRDTTISGPISITNGGSIAFDATNNGTATIGGSINLGLSNIDFIIANGTNSIDMLVSGIISNGAVTKSGPGTLAFSGPNTYGGGTFVNAGILLGDTTSLQGTIVDNAEVIFDQTVNGTFNGSLSGSGTLIKEGAASLILATSNPVTGPVFLTEGTLQVDGTLGSGGTMITSAGTRLQGTGIISKNITIGGTLAPGDGIGTLNLSGSEILASGSTLEIELNPAINDFLFVTGTLAIQNGSTLSIMPIPGTYLNTYTIVHTTAGVTGTFSTVTSSLPAIQFSVHYTPFDIFLGVAFLPFSDLVTNPNALEVARCLDEGSCSSLTPLINTINFLPSVEDIQNALLQLQPSAFTSLAIVQQNSALYLKNALYNRLDEVYHSCLESFGSNRLWASALGGRTSQASLDEEPGFIANSPGAFIGVDSSFANTIIGAAIGYTYTDLKWNENRGNGAIQSGYYSLYGRFDSPLLFTEGALIGAYNNYSINRTISISSTAGSIQETAHSNHSGLEGSVHMKSGLNFVYQDVLVSPFLSLDYDILHENGFKEWGAQDLNLTVQSKNSDILIAEGGLDISRCIFTTNTVYTPFIRLGAVRESRFQGSKEKAHFSCGCNLDVKGLYPSRTLGSIGAGFNALFPSGTFSLLYQGKFGSNYNDQSLYLQYLFNY